MLFAGIFDNIQSDITNADLRQIVESLCYALELRDSYATGHSMRVATLSVLIGNAFDFDEETLFWIYIGGCLHDIGKIGISDVVLHKPGVLTDPEYVLIKKHSELGADIISKIDALSPVIEIIRHHHERVDGKGYPDGIEGPGFSTAARIVAVADSIDAMASHKRYRKALGWAKVKFELKDHAGSQFDLKVVTEAVKILDEWSGEEWDQFFSTFVENESDIVEVNHHELMHERHY